MPIPEGASWSASMAAMYVIGTIEKPISRSIVGQSVPEDRDARYVGLVHTCGGCPIIRGRARFHRQILLKMGETGARPLLKLSETVRRLFETCSQSSACAHIE